MPKKRPRRKASKPPPERGASARRPGAGRTPILRQQPPRHLQYKVVELSTVDEHSLERVLNHWTPHGWNLDGVQFAMRESSKRPAMAFVFFTREVDASAEEQHPHPAAEPERSPEETREHLERLAGVAASPLEERAPRVDPHTRLRQLAGLDEPGSDDDVTG